MGGTVPTTGAFTISSLRDLFVVQNTSFSNYGIPTTGPFALSQLKNMSSLGCAYCIDETLPIPTSNNYTLYAYRSNVSFTLGSLRGVTIPEKQVQIRMRGIQGTEVVSMTCLSRSGAVLANTGNITLPTTFSNYTLTTISSQGEAVEPARVTVSYLNDIVGRDVEVRSITYNGVEAMWPTRVADTNGYYASNDLRRHPVANGDFAWQATYDIMLAKVGCNIPVPGYFPP